MREEEPLYYVYTHRDKNDTVRYIGRGCYGRAWATDRTSAHRRWMVAQILARGPCAHVHIETFGLTKSAAETIEKQLIDGAIRGGADLFNVRCGQFTPIVRATIKRRKQRAAWWASRKT